MKKLLIVTLALAVLATSGMTAFASAFEGSTDYYFESSGSDEFYNRSEQQYNYEGEIPPELLDIYDFAAPTVYTSEYGINIVLPDSGTVMVLPADTTSEPVQSTPSEGSQTAPSEQSEYPETWAGIYVPENAAYNVTPVENLRNADGSIGRLQIPAIGLDVKVYDGDELAAMKKGVGHIGGTSVWDSNVGMVGHNRGVNSYFGKLKTLSAGDEIIYTTNAGKRVYRVVFVGQIDETDWSMLQYTTDNRLSLVTCVENVPNKRVLVQAVEVK